MMVNQALRLENLREPSPLTLLIQWLLLRVFMAATGPLASWLKMMIPPSLSRKPAKFQVESRLR